MPQMKTSTTAAKVTAASAGGGIGAAVAMIVLWMLESYAGVSMPGPVQAAATVVVTALVAWAAGYMQPPGEKDQVVF